MEIIILGSGTGIPTARRSSPGLVIKTGEKPILFDSGSGCLHQLSLAGIDYHQIHYLFYTHFFHPDHVNDLTAILFANKYDRPEREKTLNIIGPRGMKNFYRNIRRLFPLFERMPFPVNIQEVMDDQITLDSAIITSKPLVHQEVDCVGYRIESGGKVVTYTGDTDYCPNLIELGKDADLLISECSFPDQFKVAGHLSPRLAGEIATKTRAKQLLLTHLYPLCDDYDISGEVKNNFSGEVMVAEDLMRITI